MTKEEKGKGINLSERKFVELTVNVGSFGKGSILSVGTLLGDQWIEAGKAKESTAKAEVRKPLAKAENA